MCVVLSFFHDAQMLFNKYDLGNLIVFGFQPLDLCLYFTDACHSILTLMRLFHII